MESGSAASSCFSNCSACSRCLPAHSSSPLSARIDDESGKFARQVNLGQSFTVAAKGRQKRRVPVMGFGVIRIEFDRATEFLFGVCSVPHSPKSYKRQRGVRLGRLLVQLNRLLRSRKRLEIGLIPRHCRELSQQVVAVGEPNVGVGIIAIMRNRLGEGLQSLIQALGSALVLVKAAFKIKVFRLA